MKTTEAIIKEFEEIFKDDMLWYHNEMPPKLCVNTEKIKQFIKEALERVEREAEIETRMSTLYRIKLNEDNEYPLVDKSKNLADVKEALINRLNQLKANTPEDTEICECICHFVLDGKQVKCSKKNCTDPHTCQHCKPEKTKEGAKQNCACGVYSKSRLHTPEYCMPNPWKEKKEA